MAEATEDLLQYEEKDAGYESGAFTDLDSRDIASPGDHIETGLYLTQADAGMGEVIRFQGEILTDWLTRVGLDTIQRVEYLEAFTLRE